MGNIDYLKEKIKKQIENLKPRSIKMAQHIFDHPELSNMEFETQKYLINELKKNGFEIYKGVGGLKTAFRAEFDCKKKGPTVAFIAEYDALPKLGHACHHHIIGSGSVNIAIALSKIYKELNGKIVCIGTPAEEIMDAKGIMAKNKAFDDIDVGLIFHGGEGYNARPYYLASDALEFSFKGKASHAAEAPHLGINALDAVIMLFNSINALRQQLKDDVRIHGNIIKGGDAVNIIPQNAVARFLIRSKNRKYLNKVVNKVKNCAKGSALQTGAKLKISSFEDPGSDLMPNSNLLEEYENNIISLGIKIETKPFSFGSSDIGNLGYFIPVIHPMVKTIDKGIGLHTQKAINYGKSELAYEGMLNGMKAIGMTGLRVLMDYDFLKKVKEEFNERKKNL